MLSNTLFFLKDKHNINIIGIDILKCHVVFNKIIEIIKLDKQFDQEVQLNVYKQLHFTMMCDCSL